MVGWKSKENNFEKSTLYEGPIDLNKVDENEMWHKIEPKRMKKIENLSKCMTTQLNYMFASHF